MKSAVENGTPLRDAYSATQEQMTAALAAKGSAVTRMLIAHAGNGPLAPEGDGDDE